MAKILVTGSSDGIGLVAARNLVEKGHQVTVHGRNHERAQRALDAAKGASQALVADISTIAGMRDFVDQANKAADPFDVVIHNAGVGPFGAELARTQDGFARTFAVNSLAPYVLTALIRPPKRLIYISSSLHMSGDGSLQDIEWAKKPWNGSQAYNDSKLHNVMLAFAVARLWKDTQSVAVDPKWIKTKLGGQSAPGSLESGADTMTFLADTDASSIKTGSLYANRKPTSSVHPDASNLSKQDQYIQQCAQLSGVQFPN